MKTVLITGGTAGIGRALAEAYLSRGDHVAVCGRSQAALDRFSRQFPKALAIQADVTSEKAREAMLEAVAQTFGQLDILINNAGVFIERDFVGEADPTHDLENEIAINLTGPIQLTHDVLKRWPAPEAIVFVTSGFALVSPKRAPDIWRDESRSACVHGEPAAAARRARHARPRASAADRRYPDERELQGQEDAAREGG